MRILVAESSTVTPYRYFIDFHHGTIAIDCLVISPLLIKVKYFAIDKTNSYLLPDKKGKG